MHTFFRLHRFRRGRLLLAHMASSWIMDLDIVYQVGRETGPSVSSSFRSRGIGPYMVLLTIWYE